MTTLDLTPAQAAEHDAELLTRIRSSKKPLSLLGLFDGVRPIWAEEALARLLEKGHVEERDDRILLVTDAGRKVTAANLAEPQTEHPSRDDWELIRGPRGAQGWRNKLTDEIVYSGNPSEGPPTRN